MPTWPLQSQCDAFYGNPRGANGKYNPNWARLNLAHVPCPWALYTYNTDPKKHIAVPYITIHKKCADSLKRVLDAVWQASGKDQKKIDAGHFNLFSGSFNYRPKRRQSTLSMHAYGAAIDWDAPENQFRSQKHLFQANTLLVAEFEREGWVWGGRWASPDAMHVQAARVR